MLISEAVQKHAENMKGSASAAVLASEGSGRPPGDGAEADPGTEPPEPEDGANPDPGGEAGDDQVGEAPDAEGGEGDAREGEADEGQEADAGDNAPAEGAEGDGEGDGEPIEAVPQSWGADRAAEWASLPKPARTAVLEAESEIQRVRSEAGREKAALKKEVEPAKAEYAERVKRLDDLVPKLEERARSKYEGLDWRKLATELSPEEYNQLRAEYESDAQTYREAQEERRRAAQKAENDRIDSESATLMERNPQYQGEKGQKLFQDEAAKVHAFGRQLGFNDAQLNAAGAIDYEVLRDAMAYRDLRKTAAAPPAKKPPAPAQTAVKPAPRKRAGDTAKRRVQDAQKQFEKAKQSGSVRKQIAAAAALHEARKGT